MYSLRDVVRELGGDVVEGAAEKGDKGVVGEVDNMGEV